MLFFIASRTGMQVKRAAVGAEGFVLDHYDRAALDGYLRAVGDRLMTAFGPRASVRRLLRQPRGLQRVTGPATSSSEFQQRRGYDLKPHLPALAER